MAANPNGTFQSCIGKGTKVSGKLTFREPARIEGEAEGEISGDEIVIAPGAIVSARIAAVRLTIGGTVSGEVFARQRIELLPTARLRCTLTTPTLVLNEGAQFDGECKMPRDETAVPMESTTG